jgi:hypothetical protein
MFELQETVAVLLLLILVLLIDPQLRPDGTESVKAMLPLKPRIKAMVRVELLEEPTLTLDAVVADMVKSGGVPKVNEAVVE